MPHLRTDDGPRKLRAVWLGPKGATLPFEWTYVQWAAVLIGIVVAPLLLGQWSTWSPALMAPGVSCSAWSGAALWGPIWPYA